MALRKSIVNRFTLVYIVIVLAFVLAIARMLSIITVEQEAWMVEAAKLQCANREIKPERGNLFADDGSLITATIPYYNIYMDMKVENYSTEKGRKMFEENIDSLSICLSQKFGDKTPAQYKAMIKKGMLDGKRSLRLYSRRVSYIDLMEIKQFPIIREGKFKSGFYYEELANRENMYGSLANRTLGDVNLEEGTGKYGLEMYYDSLLSGVPGSERGHLVGGGRWAFIEEKAPVHGANIYTTIDIEMQDICETAMREKLAEIDAVSACVVLMEVKTGAIRAMVNLERASDGTYFEGRNMAVSDLSEPGSTFKTMSLMVALDNGVCDTADVLDLNHGLWKFGPRTMKDHNYDRGGYGELTVAEVLAQSSNVGVSRVIDEYYKDKPMDFVNAILDTKFAEQLDFGIPGIARPIIPTKSDKRWSRTTLPWMSIGYEVQVPPIYTLNFYNAIANGGKMMRPYLVKEVRRGEQVLMKNEPKVMKESICRKETLGKVQGMLEGVIKYGTGKPMRMKQFDIAGKTGTAQLEYANGKAKGHQITFCGYFPADAPLYSCIVVIKKPTKKPSAAGMCGEVFTKVAERVYAKVATRDINELTPWTGDDKHPYNLPSVKSGLRTISESALTNLGVSYESKTAEWVRFGVEKESGKLLADENRLVPGLVPDVVGMGAIDAIYLMENSGLEVEIKGVGAVKSQSIKAGEEVQKGAIVVLEME